MFLFGMRISTFVAVVIIASPTLFDITNAEATTNLVSNGDFETGDLTGWTWTPTQYAEPAMTPAVVTFETVLGQPSLCFRVNPGTDDAHMGQEEGGILSQTVNLLGGTEYAVSVGASAIWNLSGAENADGGLIRLYIGGGDPLWSWDVGEIGGGGVTLRNSYSGTYTPTFTGPYDFELVFTRTYRNISPIMYHYADNLSVIPEPATVALLGLGSLSLIRRRRK